MNIKGPIARCALLTLCRVVEPARRAIAMLPVQHPARLRQRRWLRSMTLEKRIDDAKASAVPLDETAIAPLNVAHLRVEQEKPQAMTPARPANGCWSWLRSIGRKIGLTK